MKDKLRSYIDVAHFGYVRKWLTLSVIIGAAAGVGSIVLYWAIQQATKFMLGLGAGYTPPIPAGEGPTVFSAATLPWMIPLITAAGGLISGLIVYKFAPEAEGHGTDAAIDAFHNKGGLIRRRIPLVKVFASAITIGSGGSAGREGPTAQIAAGVGSALADLFKLSTHDRRIAIAAGIGAGIGSIFSAPLGGAVLSMEILYRRDFETEALLPSFIASVVGYSIFGSWHGWMPVFGLGNAPAFNRVDELLGYIILGVVCGLVGIAYGRGFYAIRDLFRKMRAPNWVKPAIGGLIVGVMGVFLPQILGMGYGWLQFAINGNFIMLPLGILVAIVFGKILATSLSIGSGGSGGVFAPGLVIGGMTGATLWILLHNVTTFIPGSPESFVVVGMLALFGGIAKAPVAVILMVTEMTNEYTLLVPSMLACGIAYFVTMNSYIYENQVPSRAESPAHRSEHSIPLLKILKVKQAMLTHITTVSSKTIIAKANATLKDNKIDAIPVVDSYGDLSGMVSASDIARINPDKHATTKVDQIMKTKLVVTYPNDSLYEALQKMTEHDIRHLPVVKRDNPRQMIGMVTMNDIMACHRKETENASAYKEALK
jgi:CIC family chloride channel protein